MATATVAYSPEQPLDIETDLARARQLAYLLDAQFSIAGFKFGMDALIGLIPVAGDTIALVAGLYPLYLARKHQLGRQVELRMLANLAIDYFGGMIPLVGDLFDATYRSNLKNLAVLEGAIERSRRL